MTDKDTTLAAARLTAEDRLEILDLAARYDNAIDREDMDALMATWAEDATYEFGAQGSYEGKDAIREGIADFVFDGPGRGKRHVGTNHEIAAGGAGGEARMACYLLIFERVDPPYVVATAVFTDTLRKEDGRWLFAHRRLEVDPGWFAALGAADGATGGTGGG